MFIFMQFKYIKYPILNMSGITHFRCVIDQMAPVGNKVK